LSGVGFLVLENPGASCYQKVSPFFLVKPFRLKKVKPFNPDTKPQTKIKIKRGWSFCFGKSRNPGLPKGFTFSKGETFKIKKR